MEHRAAGHSHDSGHRHVSTDHNICLDLSVAWKQHQMTCFISFGTSQLFSVTPLMAAKDELIFD